MLIVLLQWAFIFIVLFGLSRWTIAGCGKWLKVDLNALPFPLQLLTGLALLTTLCNLFSFFIRISWEIDIAIFLFALAGFFFVGKKSGGNFKLPPDLAQWHPFTQLFGAIIVAVALLKTIGPSEVEDEWGYHLPLIRWIENYPVVPGIANLEDRMGFNPAKYIADAFFSVPWLFKGGLYELNSFLSLLFNAFLLAGLDRLLKGNFKYLLSDLFCFVSSLFMWRFYLTTVDADLVNIFLGTTLLVLLLQKAEDGTLAVADARSAFMFLLLAWLLSVKFSSVLLGLPMLAHLIPLILRKMNFAFLAKITCIALLLLLPWMGRNYVISGYPIYPLYQLTLGHPDWQLPVSIAKGQHDYVSWYAKNEMVCHFPDYRIEDAPFREWFAAWRRANEKSLASYLVLIGLPVSLAFFGAAWLSSAIRRSNKAVLTVLALLGVAVAIWFFKVPNIRFFWAGVLAFILLPPAVCLRYLNDRVTSSHPVNMLKWFKIAAITMVAVGSARSIFITWNQFPKQASYWLAPERIRDLKEFKIISLGKNVQVKVAAGSLCYGAMPPCLTYNYLKDIRLRGEKIEDGFRADPNFQIKEE